MRRTDSTRSEARLLAGIAAELERHLRDADPGRTAIAALERLGVGVVVSVETTPGPAPLKVKLPNRESAVPEWSQEDEDILRSLGIAGDTQGRNGRSTSKPGRRQQG